MFKRFGKMKYLMDAAGGDGGAGGGGDDAAAKAAAEAAAAKATADKEAADKAAADKAAADKAAGKTGPSDEEARLLKENMKKKEEIKAAQAELTKMTDQLKQFEGIDPELVKKMLADAKTAEEKQLESKGEWDRLKARMAEEHTKELATIKEQLAAAQAQAQTAGKTINELSIGTLFGQSKFITDELTLTPGKAKLIYSDYFDLEEGKVVGYDKPRGEKNRTAIVDAYGNGMDFDSAMRKIVEADPEKDYLFKSKLKPGAGSDSKKMDVKPQGGEKNSLSKISEGMKVLNMPT